MTTGEKTNWAVALPWMFLVLLPVGFGVLAVSFWIADPDWQQLYFMTSSAVIVLSLSMIAHVWVFCRVSDGGVGAVWRPALILNVVIILPSPALFIVASFLGHSKIIPTWPLTYLCMAGIAGVLIFCAVWLMRSRIFAPILRQAIPSGTVGGGDIGRRSCLAVQRSGVQCTNIKDVRVSSGVRRN